MKLASHAAAADPALALLLFGDLLGALLERLFRVVFDRPLLSEQYCDPCYAWGFGRTALDFSPNGGW
jgi:hypothetical protein